MKRTPLQVLLVEDNAGDARLVRELLGKEHFEVRHVESLAAAATAVGEGGCDVILLDLSLPDASQRETMQWMQSVARQLPVVVLTGRHDADLGITLVGAGIEDYLEKNGLHGEVLSRTARHAVERASFHAQVERLRQAELRAKDDVLGHVSHELRTPLNAVYQFASLLHDGVFGGLSSEQVDCVDTMLRNVAQLRRMIGDLLEATRCAGGTIRVDRQQLPLQGLFDELARTVSPLAADKQVAFHATWPPDLPSVLADGGRVRQIVTNLLDNALKFTPAGGRIVLSAEMAAAHRVVVTVSDTGCGIAPAEQARIFERLYQVEDGGEATRKGLGLGLHLCRDLVTRMGGELWVESALHQGSRFHFSLPAVSRPAASEEAHHA